MMQTKDTLSESPPADLLLYGKLVNVDASDISESYVGIRDGIVTHVGKKSVPAKNLVKLDSEYILPAYVDGHIHIESSLMIPSQFAATVIPRGTCCVVADPHEIANVRGVEGINFMMEDSCRTPRELAL